MPAIAALVLAILAPISVAETPRPEIRIGSKRFTESYILAQILAQSAAPHAATRVLPGLGNTAVVLAALRAGSIDAYPEYTGTIDREILGNTQASSPESLREQLARIGLATGVPLGFNNGYALAMRADLAQRLGISRISDLSAHPGLRLGLSNEFIGRADGWQGLSRRYRLPQAPTGLDHGLAYDAIASGQIDLIDIYTTDARIGELRLRVLDDDAGFFPRYDAVLLYRLDLPSRFPEVWAAWQRLARSINEQAMISMNARAELDGLAFEAVAREYLVAALSSSSATASASAPSSASGSATASAFSPTSTSASQSALAPGSALAKQERRGFTDKLLGADLVRLTLEHLGLVLGSVALACALGIPLSLLIAPHARARAVALGACGLLQTIPSLAMLAALIGLLGRIGALPALLALALYALLPIVRNTVTGLEQVPRELKLASDALGLSRALRLRLIEIPLAMPTMLAGVRTATTIAVGTATIAAFVGAGGYGERIVTGLALNDHQLMLAGALPSALLALAFEAIFELFARTRRGA